MALGAFTGVTSRCTDPQLLAFPSVNQKGEAEFGLEMLYTEAVEQWQKHVTGMRPVRAGVIVRLHR